MKIEWIEWEWKKGERDSTAQLYNDNEKWTNERLNLIFACERSGFLRSLESRLSAGGWCW